MSDRPLTETITVTREVPRNIRDLVLFHQEMRKVEATLVRDLTPDELVRLARHFDGRPCPTRVGPPAAAATCPHSRLTPGCAPCWEAYATALVKLLDDPVATLQADILVWLHAWENDSRPPVDVIERAARIRRAHTVKR